ncbi:MAG: rod shape-determining protein MreD [Sphingomonas sp.]|uniref:rod shape-determining protein MreD n=1 Tax=Sphingomonas sp. TaxID=28214 RepID=UPI003F7F621D
MSRPPSAFAEPASPTRLWLIPVASVMAGSLVTILPFIASFPILPPFGLMILAAWRLLRAEALRFWAPIPFGFFDDLVSGQPMGSAVLLWSMAFLAIDLLDQRLVARDFWQDWVLAAGAIAFALIGGRLIATGIEAHVDTLLLIQVIVAVLLYPFVARLVAWLDVKRGRA